MPYRTGTSRKPEVMVIYRTPRSMVIAAFLAVSCALVAVLVVTKVMRDLSVAPVRTRIIVIREQPVRIILTPDLYRPYMCSLWTEMTLPIPRTAPPIARPSSLRLGAIHGPYSLGIANPLRPLEPATSGFPFVLDGGASTFDAYSDGDPR